MDTVTGPAPSPVIFWSRHLQLSSFDHSSGHRIEALARILNHRGELEAVGEMLQHLSGSHLAEIFDEINQTLEAFV